MDNFWKGKRVLITGANGFLGSHLSIALLEKGAEVIGLIKENPKVSYLQVTLKGLRNPKIKIIKSDLVYFLSLFKLFKFYKPDICLHVAAKSIVDIAKSSPLATFQTNIKGTWNILEIARICNTKAIVVASSGKAYGQHQKLPYKEDAALQALHPYDVSKACADMLTSCYANTYGLNAVVTRCANIYGPGDFNFSRIIPDTIRSAILGENPIIHSDGTPLRDYIYIDDVVDAYLILTKKLYNGNIKPGEAFNFGTGKPINVLSLVNKILTIANKPALRPKILTKRKITGKIDRQYLSSQKAKSQLGWASQYSLAKGLKITFAWYAEYLKCRNP